MIKEMELAMKMSQRPSRWNVASGPKSYYKESIPSFVCIMSKSISYICTFNVVCIKKLWKYKDKV